jgi:hypothetical protein
VNHESCRAVYCEAGGESAPRVVAVLARNVIYRVLTEEGAMARRWLSSLKKWMKAEFRQEEILIVQRTVGLIP